MGTICTALLTTVGTCFLSLARPAGSCVAAGSVLSLLGPAGSCVAAGLVVSLVEPTGSCVAAGSVLASREKEWGLLLVLELERSYTLPDNKYLRIGSTCIPCICFL
jgi:hypothetical protein